jgi:hypothetical protein
LLVSPFRTTVSLLNTSTSNSVLFTFALITVNNFSKDINFTLKISVYLELETNMSLR